MASHFRWYGTDSDVTIPFNARYSYPSQSNKTTITVPRITPKNQAVFSPGNPIRIEIPAQGYINPANTTLEFDVTLSYTTVADDHSIIRFQNNIQSIFSRLRIMYGSTPLEDIPEYGFLVRSLTEWTATGQNGGPDQMSIADGVGKKVWGTSGGYPNSNDDGILDSVRPLMVNTRQSQIQGISLQRADLYAPDTDVKAYQNANMGSGWGAIPFSANSSQAALDGAGQTIEVTRRYQIQLHAGLFQQGKLLPVKYMASQLAIELNLEPAANCIFWQKGLVSNDSGPYSTISATPPTYSVSNVNFIPEILEFDTSYDESFLQGLASGGVPIKFSSWNHYTFATPASSSMTFSIPERNRSIKSVFMMQQRDPKTIETDSGASFYSSNTTVLGNTLQEYQFRIGGRMFPASPVQCSTQVGGDRTNGGAEAYVELAKALKTIGDYRLSVSVNSLSWAAPYGILPGGAQHANLENTSLLPEFDGKYSAVTTRLPEGTLILHESEASRKLTGTTDNKYKYAGRCAAGNLDSGCFAMAIDLETSNGLEISGLNAEEQSDISITMRWSAPQVQGFVFQAFTYYDAMIVLHENNVLELIK